MKFISNLPQNIIEVILDFNTKQLWKTNKTPWSVIQGSPCRAAQTDTHALWHAKWHFETRTEKHKEKKHTPKKLTLMAGQPTPITYPPQK